MNYDEIGQGLIELYDEIFSNTKRLKKKVYKDDIEYYKNQYKELFGRLKTICDDEERDQETLKKLSAFVPGKVFKDLESVTSKRKRNLQLIDYNLAMVSYFVPLIGDIKSEDADEFAQQMVDSWNEVFPETKIGKASVSNIEGGFKSSLCYVTTAVCRNRNQSDDCYELSLLREYRDHYLLQAEGGRAIVEEYYDIAPTIVKRIDKQAQSSEIYDSIWNSYIQPCVSMIEKQEKEACRELYTEMIHQLEKKYLYS